MPDISESVASYQAAWGESDEGARRSLLDTAWAGDGLYLDPSGRADGRDALIEHIGGFQKTFAGHTMEPTSAVDAHDGYLRFGWRLLDPDGKQILEGVDFGAYDDAGRITLIVGFFGPWPELAV
ncbi:MAG: nuclear transport factor 2 family protein [Actinomycetota bacterium]